MQGHAIDAAGVDHHGQRTGKGSLTEGLEILLTQHLGRQVGRCAVLTRPRGTVGEVVLGAGSHMEAVNVVGVVALIALDFCHYHLGIDYGILAEALPDAGPAGVTAQIHHGVIDPGTVGSTTLIGRNLCHLAGQCGIERGTQVDGLREERSALRIGDAVVVVESIDIGNADILHGLLLNEANPLLPLLYGSGTCSRGIEDGADLPLGDERVEHGLVELPDAPGIVGTHDVEVQLQHLPYLLVERHTGKRLLYLGFQRSIAGNGRLNTGLCHHKHGDTGQ